LRGLENVFWKLVEIGVDIGAVICYTDNQKVKHKTTQHITGD